MVGERERNRGLLEFVFLQKTKCGPEKRRKRGWRKKR
jgi:hypothetical protein